MLPIFTRSIRPFPKDPAQFPEHPAIRPSLKDPAQSEASGFLHKNPDTRLPHRTFKDLFGRTWDVWEVIPTGLVDAHDNGDDDELHGRASRPVLTNELRDGWLAFQWDAERRRLAPIPDGWVGLDDGSLQRLLERAAPAGKPRRLVE